MCHVRGRARRGAGARGQVGAGRGQRPAVRLEEAAQVRVRGLRPAGRAAGARAAVQACPATARNRIAHCKHESLPAGGAQAGFRKELVKEVAAFVLDARAFRTDWELQGPMVPGLDPMEAVDRLKKFQQLFEARRAAAPGLLAPATEAFPGARRRKARTACGGRRRLSAARAGAQAQVGQLLQRRGAVRAAGHAVRGPAADRAGARPAQPPVLVRPRALRLLPAGPHSSRAPGPGGGAGRGARRLYVNVITTIRGLGDLLWTDVVAQVDGMTEQVLAFQAQANKLPKARACCVCAAPHPRNHPRNPRGLLCAAGASEPRRAAGAAGVAGVPRLPQDHRRLPGAAAAVPAARAQGDAPQVAPACIRCCRALHATGMRREYGLTGSRGGPVQALGGGHARDGRGAEPGGRHVQARAPARVRAAGAPRGGAAPAAAGVPLQCTLLTYWPPRRACSERARMRMHAQWRAAAGCCSSSARSGCAETCLYSSRASGAGARAGGGAGGGGGQGGGHRGQAGRAGRAVGGAQPDVPGLQDARARHPQGAPARRRAPPLPPGACSTSMHACPALAGRL